MFIEPITILELSGDQQIQLFAGIRTFRYTRKSLPSIPETARLSDIAGESATNAIIVPSGDMAPIPPVRFLTLTTDRREKSTTRMDLFSTVINDSPVWPCSRASSARTDCPCNRYPPRNKTKPEIATSNVSFRLEKRASKLVCCIEDIGFYTKRPGVSTFLASWQGSMSSTTGMFLERRCLSETALYQP